MTQLGAVQSEMEKIYSQALVCNVTNSSCIDMEFGKQTVYPFKCLISLKQQESSISSFFLTFNLT